VLALVASASGETSSDQAIVLACRSAAHFSKQPISPTKPSRETAILTWMRHTGRQLGAIALLALLVRAVVPGHYMLASAETPDGRYLIVQLCDGHAGPAKAINLDTGEQIDAADISKDGPEDSQPGQPPCVFAGTASVVLPAITSEPVGIVIQRDAAVATSHNVRPGRGIAAPPPPSTGPPPAT